jgi:3-phosphoshikimate 1-carboxyvinyltransferase
LQGVAEQLSASKSISNRALILKALGGNRAIVNNLSNARDTQLMIQALECIEKVIDVKDAGTTMRFLTAFFSLTGKNKILTGTARMKERPIGLLVNALRELGASIHYLEKDGFPPLEVAGFSKQISKHLSIPGDVSSQYISALMMVAPTLPQGLEITLTGKVGSMPYIEMTAALMKEFGIECQMDWLKNRISIAHQNYQPTHYTVEADWSSASYWFGFTALAQEANISLPNISEKSLQGDRAIVEIMNKLGVIATARGTSLLLTKKEHQSHIDWNFTHCPDLAQTVLPVCAAKGITGTFTGLESLRIKETDRIAALQRELAKIGATLSEPTTGCWKLEIQTQHIEAQTSALEINTYHDHRMAMGFAPWATLFDLKIESPEVVNKSYPGFWNDMKGVGFELSVI